MYCCVIWSHSPLKNAPLSKTWVPQVWDSSWPWEKFPPPCLESFHSLIYWINRSCHKKWQCPYQIGWLGSMENLSLGLPLASWSLSNWNPVWGTSSPSIIWWLGMEVHWQACAMPDVSYLIFPPLTASYSWRLLILIVVRVVTHPTLWTSFPSWLPLPLCNKLSVFALFLGTFFTSTNYATGMQVVVTLATQTTLMECYGQLSFILDSNIMAICSVDNAMLLTDSAIFDKIASPLAACNG